MSDALGQLLELRVRFRRNPEARALARRALVLVAKAAAKHADDVALDLEVAALCAELARRFAPTTQLILH
jgi:hypothetical protein